jgi:hypothetical protein
MLVKPVRGCCWTRASTSPNLRSSHLHRPPEAVWLYARARPGPRPAPDGSQMAWIWAESASRPAAIETSRAEAHRRRRKSPHASPSKCMGKSSSAAAGIAWALPGCLRHRWRGEAAARGLGPVARRERRRGAKCFFFCQPPQYIILPINFGA